MTDTTAIIDPLPTHNQVSVADLMEILLAEMKEALQPLLQEWHGGDGKPGLADAWVNYQKHRLVLENDEQVKKATEFAKKLSKKTAPFGLIQQFTNIRASTIAPLKDGADQIKNIIDTYIGPMVAAEEGLRARLQAYADEQLRLSNERKRLAAEEAARIAKSGRPEAIQQAAAVINESAKPIEAVKSERGASMETRTPLEFQGVENFDLVPREWLCVDEKKVRAAITTKGGVTSIPGLIIKEVARVVIK